MGKVNSQEPNMATTSRFVSILEIGAVIREASKLLENDQGNNGRAMRRFLGRHGGVLSDKVVFVQSFCFEDGFSPAQLLAIEAYAGTVHLLNAANFPKDVGIEFCGTTRDEEFGAVGNAYIVHVSVPTASVRLLRSMVQLVLVINGTLHDFAASPNATALQDCPTYEYRGLSCIRRPWAVSGTDLQGGGGVLEWCYDEADANERLALLQAHPQRFTNLRIDCPLELGSVV